MLTSKFLRQLLQSCCVWLLVCTFLAACQSKPLRVASDLDHAPFAWVDEDGHALGSEPELMAKLSRSLDRELVWVRVPFNELFQTLADGQADVACATLGLNEERQRRFLHTQAYYRSDLTLVVREGAELQPQLSGQAVLVGKGTTAASYLGEHFPQALPMTAEDKQVTGAQVDLLLDGSAIGWLQDGYDGRLLVERYPNRLTTVDLGASENYHLYLQKEDLALQRALERELGELLEDGWVKRLHQRFELE